MQRQFIMCQSCHENYVYAECENCWTYFCFKCFSEHECDAQKASQDGMFLLQQQQQMIKLPSLPATPKIHQLPSHHNSREQQCRNYQFCGKLKLENSKYCGIECQITYIVLECQKQMNFDTFRQQIEDIMRGQEQDFFFNILDQPIFKPKLTTIQVHQNTIVNNDQRTVNSTILAYPPFYEGNHKWLLRIDNSTKLFVKIGISLSDEFNLDNAFTDYDFGYGFFSIGQLRHNSNMEGEKYGIKCKGENIIEVQLNMIKGTLGYKINGQDFGIAFQSDQFKKGPIYPALSFCQQACVQYCFKRV